MPANPMTADSIPSMKSVARASSVIATTITTAAAARGGITLSLITLMEESLQLLSFASAVAASVAMMYAATSARTISKSTPCNKPWLRGIDLHVD